MTSHSTFRSHVAFGIEGWNFRQEWVTKFARIPITDDERQKGGMYGCQQLTHTRTHGRTNPRIHRINICLVLHVFDATELGEENVVALLKGTTQPATFTSHQTIAERNFDNAPDIDNMFKPQRYQDLSTSDDQTGVTQY